VVRAEEQLHLVVFEAPLAARKLRRRSATWLAIYIASAVAVLALVGWQLIAHQGDVTQLALDYVVPADWHFAARALVAKFFAQQEQLVLVNAVIVGSLLVVQATLFPLKEQVSAALETDANLVSEPMEEFPIWFQAWEEIKIFLAMLAAQATIFWIGYTDDPLRRKLAVVLSFAVLAANVGVDFLSPVLQRHKLRYSQILKSLFAHPLLLLGFGALFALPAIAATALAANLKWSFGAQVGVAFFGQIVGGRLAVIGGTAAGGPSVAAARGRVRSHPAARLLAWAVLLGLLAWNGYRFGAVALSLQHKTQLLKCEYTIDWSSFEARLPTALDVVVGTQRDAITVGVAFDLSVRNPTRFDVEIERNRLEVRHAGTLIATTSLPQGRVASGSTQQLHVTLPLTVAPSQALELRSLLTAKAWTMTLYLEVAGAFELPIYLMTKP